MRVSPPVGATLVSIILAACGGGSSTHSSTATTSQARRPPAKSAEVSPSCRVLTAADFRRIGASTPANVQHLANPTGQRRTCSDVFVDASGGLILVVTKTPGGARELAAARRTAEGGSAGTRPRPVPGLPSGYVAGRQLGFLERDQVVTLSTGYTTTGQPELATAQLVLLAGVISHR